MYGFTFAQAVKVDRNDNIWVVDRGSSMVIKFSPDGRLAMTMGRKPEAVPLLAGEVVNADQNGACAGMNAIIAELPKTTPTAHVVSSAGCKARPDRLHFTPEGYRELGKRYGEKMLSLLGYKVAETKQPEPPGPTPTTYCNPISLPNYPLGRRARDVTVGAPVPRNDWLWLVDRQQQFRELADVSVLWHEGAWYMYPSVDMAWVSNDGGATITKDGGRTWSNRVRVSDGLNTRTALLPWIETGPTQGSVGIVWYGTSGAVNIRCTMS